MRIRNRKVPLPLSSLSPLSIWSDPNFNQSSVVQLQLDQNPPGNLSLIADAASYFDDPQPSDHPIGGRSNSLVVGGRDIEASSKVCLEEDERRIDGERRSNDSRKEDVLSEEIETMALKQSSSSHQAVGKWYEGEKAFPVKKRRGSIERRSNEDASTANGKKMKTNTNKKCEQPNVNKDQQQQQLEDQIKETKEDVSFVNTTTATGSTSTSTSGAKKRGRGGALMEGSRCSRVNGRGWRCCQQTLVGYSLCEHHLGKGRLRSMNNVRSRSKSTITSIAPKKENSQPLSVLGSSLSLEEQELKLKVGDHVVEGGHEREDHQEKQPLIVKKRKMKLGMVKARSLSSLLGLANEAISMAKNENK